MAKVWVEPAQLCPGPAECLPRICFLRVISPRVTSTCLTFKTEVTKMKVTEVRVCRGAPSCPGQAQAAQPPCSDFCSRDWFSSPHSALGPALLCPSLGPCHLCSFTGLLPQPPLGPLQRAEPAAMPQTLMHPHLCLHLSCLSWKLSAWVSSSRLPEPGSSASAWVSCFPVLALLPYRGPSPSVPSGQEQRICLTAAGQTGQAPAPGWSEVVAGMGTLGARGAC